MSHYPRFTTIQEKFASDILNGDFYRCHASSETVADDGYVNYFIKTKAGGVSVAMQVEVGGLSELIVTEGASMENAGTNETLDNLNRISRNTSTMSVTHGNSWSNGTVIYEDHVGAAAIGNATGYGENRPSKIILAGSEHYNIAVQNLSGGAKLVCLSLNFTDVA